MKEKMTAVRGQCGKNEKTDLRIKDEDEERGGQQSMVMTVPRLKATLLDGQY